MSAGSPPEIAHAKLPTRYKLANNGFNEAVDTTSMDARGRMPRGHCCDCGAPAFAEPTSFFFRSVQGISRSDVVGAKAGDHGARAFGLDAAAR